MIDVRYSLLALLAISTFAGSMVKTKTETPMPETQTFALRLKPGDDLKQSIQRSVEANQIQAGWVSTCAGSLTDYHIRFADQPEGNKASGHFEIVSLSGTLSTSGSHIHISVSDETGKTIGGHLMDECIVYTTAEIVIQATNEFRFTRENDGTTQWPELQIKDR